MSKGPSIIESVAKTFRHFSKLRFRILGLATIMDIPTARFNILIEELNRDGWRGTKKVSLLNDWIDNGKIRMWKGFSKITLEWDNWTEGSVEGKRKNIEEIAKKYGFQVSCIWRWSIYDKKI